MKDIKGYEGLYRVTEDGRVWSYPKSCSSKSGMWMKLTISTNQNNRGKSYSRYTVGLYKNKIRAVFLVHRLVAQAYIPNPENKPQVNHKDTNPLNNNINNLEWSTGFENMQHAQDSGMLNQYTEKSMVNRSLQGKKNWKNATKARRMFTMDEANKIRKTFAEGVKSTIEISIELGCSNNTISNICNNKTYQVEI